MFWRFNVLASHVDTLLEKEDVTLMELLDEDDILQECKSQNKKLIEFLIRPENIEELVNLTVVEPSDDTDEKSRYKYPNTACELLTSDVQQITDKLVEDDALLNKVYGFLENEGQLNPLLASFFSKVMGLLITRKSEMMLEFLQARDDFVGQLLKHLDTSAIMDMLLRLITCIESQECRLKCISWLNEEQLVQRLVKMIEPTESEEKHCNASQALCDIVRLSREQMSQLQERADADPLLTAIEAQETIADLLSRMFSDEKSESVIVSGLTVIQTLLEFRKMGPEGGSENITQLDTERLAQGVSNTLAALNPRFKDINGLLLDPPKQHYSTMPTTIGNLDPPLGNARLQVARLVSTLLLTNTQTVNAQLGSIGTINVLLDLYFKYVWNNFLHTQVEQIIGTVLNNPPVETDGKKDTPLLNELFTDYKFVQRILESWEDNDQQQSRPGGHRRGYMGHLTRMANHVVECMEKGVNSDRVKQLIQELDADVREKWESFLAGSLSDTNKQNHVDMIGGALHSSSEDDDTDFRDIPFPQDTAMQQAFSDYQLQQMTSNFIDQFGFNEDDFGEQEERVDALFNDKISSINFELKTAEGNPTSASLFEQACNERMQQFDDADSDEDQWVEKEITFSPSSQSRPSNPLPGSNKTCDSDSDGSSDSEEDLDSPQRIHQSPSLPNSSSPNSLSPSTTTTTTEKMDIDATEWPTNLDDVPMDAAPIAMETAASPWETNAAQQLPSESNWANFESSTTKKVSKEDENWADFSGFSSIETSSNLSSTNPEQRSVSPVAMETADSSTSNRTAAYLVSSAPADLASEVSSTKSNFEDSLFSETAVSSVSTSDTVTTTSTTQALSRLEQVADSEEPSSSTDLIEKSSTLPSGPLNSAAHQSTPRPDSSTTSSGTADSQRRDVDRNIDNSPAGVSEDLSPRQNSASSNQHPITPRLHLEDLNDEDDDLDDNFDFLSRSGLMKGSTDESASSEETRKQEEQARIEQARAAAKEAMENFTSMTVPGTSENGPV